MAIPTRGSDVGTWDTPVNSDFSSIDGYFGGVQTISVSNSPITLTAPTGIPTPSGGPTQAQNAVLSFTGAMTANVQVTFPLPGVYQIENLTTGNFVLTFAASSAGEVIAIDQGMSERVYCNGTNVRFSSLGVVGRSEMWAGLTAMPAWVTACTKPPYLLEDGSIHNFSDFPYLGKRLGGSFGGNGITTFGVPDSRGRVQLPYDGTGTRITAAGCGINGQTIGGSADAQSSQLSTPNLPPYTPQGTVATSSGSSQIGFINTATSGPVGFGGTSSGASFTSANVISSTFTGTAQGGSNSPFSNVQPSQVTGIAVIRAA